MNKLVRLALSVGTLFLAGCSTEMTGPNRAPVAVAGWDSFVLVGQTVLLDGRASFDPDGDSLTYEWSLLTAPADSAVGLTTDQEPETGLTPDVTGRYVVALVVSDGRLTSGRDVVQVTATVRCTADEDCDDSDQCTLDRCLQGVCVHEPVAGCVDECPDDPEKLQPGQCGCGVADIDTDSDGTADCIDGCPDDPNKTDPGQCGCGALDTDTDGDAVADCADGCPADPNKTDPGQCGCGNPDTDSDGDTVADCNDSCPADPDKIDPGVCGCGVPDLDSDSDGTLDCIDGCPDDPDKIDPGVCGCGVPDLDSDSDGTLDCIDGCPDDPDKIEIGVCGCGVPDDDSDGDGTLDCNDGCPLDIDKVDPGACGCGVPDDDSDGDGTADCIDGCPDDPGKTDPGQCGCGNPDTDTDGDSVADCVDPCPQDFHDDTDGDGACDSDDCAPLNPDIHPGAVETCNGLDDDCNGAPDDSGCPCAVESYNGHQYMFCPGPVDWGTARAACRSYGYTLATVENADENDRLWELINALLGGADTWHGLNDRASEDNWVWVDGSPAAYFNWDGGQPNDWGGQDCANWGDGDDGRWNDADCGDTLAYVCESACGGQPDSDLDGWADQCDCGPLDPTVFPGAVEICNGKDDDCNGVADLVAGCPCFADRYRGHLYLFCPDAITWDNARSNCLAYGYRMASVDDAQENAWLNGRAVAHLGGVTVWHGYNDIASEDVWVWENGSASGYTNWNAGEPNNSGNEDCAQMYPSGLWNDDPCDNTFAYVCETEPCPGDPFIDIDGDGICGDQDNCPITYNPDQTGACDLESCRNILDSGNSYGDGLYWINPPGTILPVNAYCDMSTRGGGWTLIAVYGNNGRPAAWGGNPYPRPGASLYGRFDARVLDPALNNGSMPNHSIDARNLWPSSDREVLLWAGGSTDDYLYAVLPAGCNFFDGSTWCQEDTHGPFPVYRSDDSLLTSDAYACTTANRQGGFDADPYDEFGLHLLDGPDIGPTLHCHMTASSLGFQDIGRIFTTFEDSGGGFWFAGVHSHWNENGDFDVPGALFIR